MAKKQVFELSSELAEELDRIAAAKEKSKVDVLRQALGLYFLVNQEINKNKKDRRIAIVENDKILEKYVLA